MNGFYSRLMNLNRKWIVKKMKLLYTIHRLTRSRTVGVLRQLILRSLRVRSLRVKRMKFRMKTEDKGCYSCWRLGKLIC